MNLNVSSGIVACESAGKPDALQTLRDKPRHGKQIRASVWSASGLPALSLFHFTAAFLLLFLCTTGAFAAPAQATLRPIGVAKVDVTSAEPIRLTGYAVRKTNSVGVEQKLWAKALAIGADSDGPAVLITLDNCGIAEATYKELVQRLEKKTRLKQARIVVSCSHTHTGPCTTAWAPNIFAQDIPPEHQATIDRYTRELIDKLEQAALAALKDRRPGRLSWSQGSVAFARNRRLIQGSAVRLADNEGGPVDHALPVLLATDDGGQVRALVANYACHCTTMGGEFNKLSGDWAGFAQESLERDHPGAIALITIGCGADSNPFPRGGADGGLAFARQHGEEIAAEVKNLLTRNFTPLNAKLNARFKQVELPFGPQFTRAQWEERAKKTGIVGYHAKKYLARLDRGETLPTTLSYYAQTWNFDDDFAMVFLSGEVVVDYARRLKREFDPARLWVTAYANYVPCYIPSRRVLEEGGYEAEDSLWYYDRPARLSTNTEEIIIKTVHGLLPKSFLFDRQKAEYPPPKTVEQALASFRTKAEFTIEAVAAEPLIESPVAIDWGSDGRLWVCEMYDYPSGLDGKWKPGGRVKVLQSSHGDGHYDQAQLFLDHLPFPTGLMAWRKGVLVCAAPDILYAEDSDGDGKADVVKKLYSGFATHNYQARVNGLSWGLDGWIYGASGLFGGKVKNLLTGQTVDLSGRDFRIKPDSGEIEPVAGISQQGRIRDDFGNWFGNDNSTLLWNFPLPDHYVRRNPQVTYPDPRVNVASFSYSKSQSLLTSAATDPNQLYPVSRTLERFNAPESANHTTSACGPEIYRDDLLGTNYYGNALICEPVHNLVTRLVLEPQGATFAGRRAADEQRSEFLASTDNWFRPVQVRTGPDGALWIVDMYRFVIEHPRWIPPERLKQLDPRAGADKGRIYRVYPREATLRPIRDLTRLSLTELAEALKTSNGPTRDLIHRELLDRMGGRADAQRGGAGLPGGPARHGLGVEALISVIATNSPISAARAHALSVVDTLQGVSLPTLERAFRDAEPSVRRTAVRVAEGHAHDFQPVLPALLKLENDPDPAVRFQLALSLGEWKRQGHGFVDRLRPDIAQPLARLAATGDPWIRAAVLTSAAEQPETILKAIIAMPLSTPGRTELIGRLIATAVGINNPPTLEDAVTAIALSLSPNGESAGVRSENTAAWKLEAVASLLEALDRRGLDLDSLFPSDDGPFREAKSSLKKAVTAAHGIASDGAADEDCRQSAIRVLGTQTKQPASFDELRALLKSPISSRLQNSVLSALGHQHSPQLSQSLLADWGAFTPVLRTAIINLLVTREAWLNDLLSAAENGTIAPTEIPLPTRQRLLKHANNAIRTRSAKLFDAFRSEGRAAVLAKYQAVSSLTGRPESGAAHFDKNCSPCHEYRGHGHAVGPNLAEFAGKSTADFLLAILDPNAAINPNFLAYNIDTKDGRALTGIIKGETA